MKKIFLIFLLYSYGSIYSQKSVIDSMAKSDILRSLDKISSLGGTTSKNSTDNDGSQYNTQTPNTNRDLFQFNKIEPFGLNKVVGKVNVKIPLYEIDFQGLKIPIELVYNSGGVKADQFATEVGLGWALNTGGEINKNIVKINDAKSNIQYSFGLSKLYEFCLGYLSSITMDFSNSMPSYNKDLPDVYDVNFLGLNSSFYIDPNLQPVHINPFNGQKISLTYERFDPNFVNKYGFYREYSSGHLCPSNPGLTKVPVYFLGHHQNLGCNSIFLAYKDVQKINIIKDHFTYDFNDFSVQIPSSASDLGHLTDSGANYTSTRSSEVTRNVNKYHISSITDNITKKKVLFSYMVHSGINDYIRQGATYNVLRLGYDGDYQAPNSIQDAVTQDYDGFIKKNITQIKTDKEIIDFEYINGRDDSKSLDILLSSPTNWVGHNKDPYLSKVYIKDYKGNLKWMYVFNYSYFDSKCTDYNLTYNVEQCRRLKLTSVYKYSDVEMQNIVDYNIFSYYEDRDQPKIGTYHVDPFGYKSPLDPAATSYLLSNNEWDPIDWPTKEYGKKYANKRMPRKPNMYKYTETQGGFSLDYYSTLIIPALSPVLVNYGGYNQELSTLEDSRAWSLKSIQYRTQGLQNFNYELNTFNWKGQQISGAGIRIASIDLIDDGKIYTTTYQYSGGQIAHLPIISNGKTGVANPVLSQNLYGKETTYNGGTVQYENVTEKLPNGGKIVEKYSSISDNPQKVTAINTVTNANFDLYNYYFPVGSESFLYMLKHPLVGQLLERNEYNDSNDLIRKTEYKYTLENKDFPIMDMIRYDANQQYIQDNNIPYTFAFDYTGPGVNVKIPAALFNLVPGTSTGSFTVGKDSRMYRNNLLEVKTTDFFNSRSLTKNKVYSYLDAYNLLKSTTDYLGADTYKSEFLYSFEQGDQFNQQMSTDDNVKTMPVGSKEFKNGKFTISNIDKFIYTPSGSINLTEKIKGYPQDDSDKTYFTRYDNKGNIIEVKNSVQTPTTFIWGYGQNSLIAKIEGATYAEVMQAFSLDPNNSNSYLDLDIVKKSDLHINDGTEGELISNLEIFRKKAEFKNFKISTYTYNTLIGIKTEYNETGVKTVYKYDAYNKLQKILDQEGNILKEYNYNFASRIFYSNTKSGSFLRANCGPGTLPEASLYTVPAGKYTSTLSQADADQKAQNDVNVNGQNYVNNNGVCKPYVCTITPTHLADIYYSSFQETSFGHIKVILSFPITGYNGSTPNWSNGVFIGTLDSLCRPNSYKNIDVSSNDGGWSVSLGPAGDVTVRSTGGNSGSSATLYFEYDKN
ncbi:DUF5977 domain-containing protein [Chryseobacterium sp. CP-77]|uniref:DUF5977 domain-containing protein n=1 Tax=Chryseobacterium sp. CP-77 TaxID=3116594 RepID=UPI002ED27DDD